MHVDKNMMLLLNCDLGMKSNNKETLMWKHKPFFSTQNSLTDITQHQLSVDGVRRYDSS